MSIFGGIPYVILSVLFWPALLVGLILSVSNHSKYKKPRLFVSDGLLHAKLGAGQVFIIIILLISLFALCERILYDLSRTVVGDGFDYVDNMKTIFVHAIFIVPVLAISIVINVFVGQQKQKYSVVLMPYFITSIILAVQLVCEIAIYFANHHTKLELYVVLLAIIAIVSYAIWFIQRLYNQRLEEMKQSLGR